MALFGRRRAPVAPTSGVDVIDAIVESVAPASDRSLLIALRPTGEASAFTPFVAGSHVDVHIDERTVRQYSLVGSDEQSDRYLMCVQREDAGRGGSLALHSRVEPGVRLRISPPRVTFSLRADRPRAVLLAGGVGVTPLIAMAERLHREGRDFEFHAYAASAEALPLHAHVLSRPYASRFTAHFSATGDSFRREGPRVLGMPRPDTALYVCGPAGFIQAAEERAAMAGWDDDQVVVENFTPVASRGGTFTVIAASTGERIAVGEDESLADALEGRGYDTMRSCGQGYCGSCVVRVVRGTPDHRDSFQSAAQHAANTEVNLCVSRSLTEELEVDI